MLRNSSHWIRRRIEPDVDGNWLDVQTNDFKSLIPLGNKDVKSGKNDKALFQLFTLGVVTARDEWVYDSDSNNLAKKVRYLIAAYNSDVKKLKGIADPKRLDYAIKWTRSTKQNLEKQIQFAYEAKRITRSQYRPFNKAYCYFSPHLNEMRYRVADVLVTTANWKILRLYLLTQVRRSHSWFWLRILCLIITSSEPPPQAIVFHFIAMMPTATGKTTSPTGD